MAIARAIQFNAKVLIMDEPTAALGPAETAQVRDLVSQLKAEGIAIFLISHDIHDVFDLADRITVMLQGKLVGTVDKDKVTKDEVLGMIIMGKLPEQLDRRSWTRSTETDGAAAPARQARQRTGRVQDAASLCHAPGQAPGRCPSKYVGASAQAVLPHWEPVWRPPKSSAGMWMPPKSREMPAWSAAS